MSWVTLQAQTRADEFSSEQIRASEDSSSITTTPVVRRYKILDLWKQLIDEDEIDFGLPQLYSEMTSNESS